MKIFLRSFFKIKDLKNNISEEFPSLTVGQDEDKNCGGNRSNQKKSPKQPAVNNFRQQPPLPPNLIILVLLVLLLEKDAKHPE